MHYLGNTPPKYDVVVTFWFLSCGDGPGKATHVVCMRAHMSV